MPTRRAILARGVLAAGSVLGASLDKVPALAQGNGNLWRMPEEGEPHAATWMAFGPSTKIWGKRLRSVAQENLAEIAKTIAAHETVNMLVREEEHDLAARLCGPAVNLLVQPIDDLWMRDTGPVFVKNASGERGGVGFNFNGWGDKQSHA